MSEKMEASSVRLMDLAADLVSAYVSNNSVPPTELPKLISDIHASLVGLGGTAPAEEPDFEKPSAAQIRKSIRPDALVSFADGKSYKTLKRHLTKLGLTPETYRAKYGLPADYPMVAASYSEQRSTLARSLGLGRPRIAEAAE